MAGGGRMYVESPRRENTRMGLADAIEWLPDRGPHWRNGIETEPWSCPIDVHAVNCDCVGTTTNNPTKELGPRGTGLVEADPFILHSDYNCSPFGRTMEEARERARHRLLMSENNGLEQYAMENLFAGAEVLVADTIMGGVAVLEQWLGDNVGTQGFLHAPYAVAPYLHNGRLALFCCDSVEQDGLHTPVGNRWVLGAGYSANLGPDGAPAPAGTAWLYATGPLVGIRGDVFFTPDLDHALDKATNDLTILAEREYVIWSECDVAAVNVPVSCCC